MTATFRDLPQVQMLLDLPKIGALTTRFSHEETADALRNTLAQLRSALRAGEAFDLPDFASDDFAARIAADIHSARALSLRPVINATGIIIHTNLGRARLAPAALAAMQAVGAAPSTLEFDLEAGARGSRHTHVEDLVCRLTGAEAAVVVNNCAAAVMLSLMATSAGRSVIASRGELIEIGGSFRLPDVIAQSGAQLREVGATNRTRIADYAAAIDPETAVLLKSHTSNFKIVGFTAQPTRAELAELAAAHQVILMEDLGSGVLIDLSRFGLKDEPVVKDILKAGVDLVMFSGDKLLGGPQAGILAGRRDIIDSLRVHPLMRAVRIDKLSLAALEATLRLYLPPHDPFAEIPVLRMVSEPADQVARRANQAKETLLKAEGIAVEVVQTAAFVGGGTLPEQDLVSWALAVSLPGLSSDALMTALRHHSTPIIGRISEDRVLLDVRTMTPDELTEVTEALIQIGHQ